MALGFNQLLKATEVILKSNNVPNIVGEAGIGKSALVSKLAQLDHAKLFTTVVSLMQKGDLSLPVPPLTSDSFREFKDYGKVADVKFGYSHTLISILQAAQDNPEMPIYWFLDEFNRGSQAVQSELMNLVLQRSVNGLKLPKQVKIIIAENPDDSMSGFMDTDYGVASGDDAIKDRTIRLILQSNPVDWLNWAKTFNPDLNRQNIHPQVIRYIKENPQDLHQQDVEDDIYPTPRSWHRISDVLYELEVLPNDERMKIQLDILSGSLGVQVATKFISFLNQIEAGLVAKELLSMPMDLLLKRYRIMPEEQKIATLKATLAMDPPLDVNFVERFAKLIKLMNPDTQYSLLLSLVDRDHFLDVIYKKAMKDERFKQFYYQLEKIAVLSF